MKKQIEDAKQAIELAERNYDLDRIESVWFVLTPFSTDWRGPALLSRVLCRDARISADPGWIDVHFALRDVSIELRRAATDLDPGFLPWLGMVLRYRYE